jgi:hypothetical protein
VFIIEKETLIGGIFLKNNDLNAVKIFDEFLVQKKKQS